MLTIISGDALSELKKQQDNSVNCCVTSPPYFGLRDYGVEGQIGLEQTPEEYVAKLTSVFREVRRVLRNDGTLWLNIGDSYAAQRSGTHQPAETLAGGRGGKMADGSPVNRDRYAGYNPTRNASMIGLKHKDLIGIPWMLAFALRADGWYLRQDIIWQKLNPMPESVKDRCTKSHEYVFLLSKSERYFFDSEAIKEPAISKKPMGNKYTDAYAASDSEEHRTSANLLSLAGLKWEKRNRRSVWTLPTKPFKGAHFATFPKDLIEPCILAGCPEGGIVLDPFAGSGTTGHVALELNRQAVLIELNPKYINLIKERTTFVQSIIS